MDESWPRTTIRFSEGHRSRLAHALARPMGNVTALDHGVSPSCTKVPGESASKSPIALYISCCPCHSEGNTSSVRLEAGSRKLTVTIGESEASETLGSIL